MKSKLSKAKITKLVRAPDCFAFSAAKAAKAMGISRKKFMKLVTRQKMPAPRSIGKRMRWDFDEVRAKFLALDRAW